MRAPAMVSIAIAVGVVALTCASFGAGYAFAVPTGTSVANHGTHPAAPGSPAAPALASDSPSSTATRALPARTVAAAPLRTCSISAAAKDPRLLHFQGYVVNAKTGEALFDRGGTTPSRTASVLKVLTSAAALHVLGPDYRLETRVVRGTKPGQVVLIGGGDVTLSRTPVGSATAYAGAPHLATLASEVKAAWARDPANKGVPIRQVVLDSSYFGGPTWQSSWDHPERTEGYMPEITALMVDGDRANPAAPVSPRSLDPIGRAGSAFAALLGGSVTTVRGVAPAGAAQLGVVRSQPVSTLIKQALIVSDNTLAETLARVTAIKSGDGNTFAAEQAGTVGGLQTYGISTAGIVVKDGSGLSPDNAVPPNYLTALFIKIMHRDGSLGVIYDGLPIAGRTGSLSYYDRFQGAASRADGEVHAKTGWIDSGYTLSGIIYSRDGTPLTFAFYALGTVTEATKYALDGITADAWACGGNLSNR